MISVVIFINNQCQDIEEWLGGLKWSEKESTGRGVGKASYSQPPGSTAIQDAKFQKPGCRSDIDAKSWAL